MGENRNDQDFHVDAFKTKYINLLIEMGFFLDMKAANTNSVKIGQLKLIASKLSKCFSSPKPTILVKLQCILLSQEVALPERYYVHTSLE